MSDREESPEGEEAGPSEIERAVLELPYIPDFPLEDIVFYFSPGKSAPQAVYHELVGSSAENWQGYYATKKGWKFLQGDSRDAEGPFRVKDLRLVILEPGRIFSPKPSFRFDDRSKPVPVPSMEKRRPLNPWKPNYIQALNFIKRYEWPHTPPRAVTYAVWEIEECGQVPGSTSWMNAERILRDQDSPELRNTLADIFYNRPEDYPLGSEVYLRVLGLSGPQGFEKLLELAKHPISRKRKIIANILGELKNKAALPSLLVLLEDEDPDVRMAALRALGKVGVDAASDPQGKVASYLESSEIPKKVWAAQALTKGGDPAHEKYLIGLVKEEPRLLTDMGELGHVLADLELVEAVPYCINRLKHEKSEFRADAAEALAKITGLDLEYQSLDTEEQRRNAIRTFNRWWEDYKKDRRKRAPA